MPWTPSSGRKARCRSTSWWLRTVKKSWGRPTFRVIVDQYEERLRTCEGVFFPMNLQDTMGDIELNLGVKGILYFEMEAIGGDWGGPSRSEIHGSYKAVVDSPVWRLIHALSSLTSVDGNTILVPGYYDDVRPPTAEEQRLINGVIGNWNEDKERELLGVARWISGATGKEAIFRFLYDPTLNIDGIWGGYTGLGVKTILPRELYRHSGCRFLAVIKNNANGIGLRDIGPILDPMDEVYGLAVARVDEVLALREVGVKKPIVLMAHASRDEAELLVREGVRLSLYVPC